MIGLCLDKNITKSLSKDSTENYDGDEEVYTILGSNEGDFQNGFLSCESPLVLALLGKKVGDVIDFNGSIIKIVSVKKAFKEKELKLNNE